MGTKYVSKHQNSALVFVVSIVLSLATLFVQPAPVSAQAQACAALPDTHGRITLPKEGSPVTITEETTYNVWILMRVKDAAHKVSVSVDSSASATTCNVEMTLPSGSPVNDWIWTKTKAAGGDMTATIPANSNVKIQIAGIASSPNVDIDKVMLINGTCVPDKADFGAACESSTPTPTPTTTGPTPTPDPNAAEFDIDGSGSIGVGDLSILIRDYPRPGQTPVANSPADFNDSGEVDISDLSKLVAKWGQTVNILN